MSSITYISNYINEWGVDLYIYKHERPQTARIIYKKLYISILCPAYKPNTQYSKVCYTFFSQSHKITMQNYARNTMFTFTMPNYSLPIYYNITINIKKKLLPIK